jgi:hypothetical protein
MAKILVSSNLNLYGNAGQFETDRSTWGFGDASYTAIRSTLQKTSGLYGALVTKSSGSDTLIIPYSFPATVGKTYAIRAKVRVPSSNPVADDAAVITMASSLDNLLFDLTVLESTTKTVLEAEDTWVDIELAVERTGSFLGPNVGGYIRVAGTLNVGGQIFIDQLEVYEYIEGEDPEEPEPEPEVFDLVFHSKNPITQSKTASPGWEASTNFRLYNDIRVEDVADSGVYTSKLKVDLPPDEDGNVVFYIAEAFRNVFSFTPPSLSQNTIVRLTDRIKRFKCFTGELEDTETVPGALDESVVNLVLFGGISKLKWPGLSYFTSYMTTNKKFLTWAPVEKYVDRLQEDYLNFWVYADTIAELQLRIKAYFDDGTNQTEITKTISPVAYGELYQIPAGPVNSGASVINAAKNLVKYELSLLDNNDIVITEVRTYHVQAIRHPLTRFFMFLNSLGAFEVLRFTGQAVKRTEFSREVVQKFLAHNYAALDGEFVSNSITIQGKHSFSSGFVKDRYAEQWHDYLVDFLRSPIVYDITSGTRVPVVITGGSHEKADQDYTRYIQFEAKPAYEDESYTPDSI